MERTSISMRQLRKKRRVKTIGPWWHYSQTMKSGSSGRVCPASFYGKNIDRCIQQGICIHSSVITFGHGANRWMSACAKTSPRETKHFLIIQAHLSLSGPSNRLREIGSVLCRHPGCQQPDLRRGHREPEEGRYCSVNRTGSPFLRWGPPCYCAGQSEKRSH